MYISTFGSLLSLPLTSVQRSYRRRQFLRTALFPADLHAYFRLAPIFHFICARVHDFRTCHTMERSPPLQSGRRRRRRWRSHGNFKFIHMNFPNHLRLSLLSLLPELLVVFFTRRRRRRPVEIKIKIIHEPVPVSTFNLPNRLLPQIRIRAAAPPQPAAADVAITDAVVLSPVWKIDPLRNRLARPMIGNTSRRRSWNSAIVIVASGEDAAENGEQNQQDVERIPALFNRIRPQDLIGVGDEWRYHKKEYE